MSRPQPPQSTQQPLNVQRTARNIIWGVWECTVTVLVDAPPQKKRGVVNQLMPDATHITLSRLPRSQPEHLQNRTKIIIVDLHTNVGERIMDELTQATMRTAVRRTKDQVTMGNRADAIGAANATRKLKRRRKNHGRVNASDDEDNRE